MTHRTNRLPGDSTLHRAIARRARLVAVRRARGFTLVELLVALSAGIVIATAAYSLSKTSMDVFNQETRVSTAQFTGTMAMNRLLADIQRAGFMMSPHIDADPVHRCPLNGETWPNLRAIQIFQPGASTETSTASLYTSRAGAQVTGNGFAPKLLRLVGNYSSTELFRIRAVNGSTIGLQVSNGAFERSWRDFQDGGPSIPEIFGCDTVATNNCIQRYVRLTDTRGKESFRRVVGMAINMAGPSPDRVDITLDSAPPGDESCGVALSDGFSQGTINPISIIEYEIVANPTVATGPTAWPADGITAVAGEAIAPLATSATDPIGDFDRSELIRRELVSPNNAGLSVVFQTSANSTFAAELVAEFAVNLDFAARVRAAPGPVVTVNSFNFGDSSFAASGANEAPSEAYVSVQALLSVRTRTPDREEPLTCAAPDPILCPGGVARGRFDLFPGGPAIQRRYARVRTLVQEVTLPNLAGSIL